MQNRWSSVTSFSTAISRVASSLSKLRLRTWVVRRPCAHCRELVAPDAPTRARFGWPEDPALRIPRAVGCALCGRTGYAGRLALFELLAMNESVRAFILGRLDEEGLRARAFDPARNVTLFLDGAQKIRQGLTTAEEVREVTGAV